MRSILVLTFSFTFLIFGTVSIVAAAVPHQMHYQGHLTASSGAPLDTTVSMTFTIYDDSSVSGAVWWTETQPGVIVDNGLFNVLLGSQTGIPDTVFDDTTRWLGIQIGFDPEITPRTKLVTVPYAFQALRVATVDGAAGGDVYGNLQLHSYLYIGDYGGEPGQLQITDGTGNTIIAYGTTGSLMMEGNLDISGKATLGWGNTNTGSDAFVAGRANEVTEEYATVGGGFGNSATGVRSTVGGGMYNFAGAVVTTVAGGQSDTADAPGATVGGGSTNRASGDYSTVSGGISNTASGSYGTVSGGRYNTATLSMNTVGGGQFNTAGGSQSTVGGGAQNAASGPNSTVSGGDADTASGNASAIGGGIYNTAGGDNSCVGGGAYNVASGPHSTVSGGYGDTASANYATVSGGLGNSASNEDATVGGGTYNTASGPGATIGGGAWNVASGSGATVSGGVQDTASGSASNVCGGNGNHASGLRNSVLGGYKNHCAGDYSVILGGLYDTLTSDAKHSIAFGQSVYVDGWRRIVFFHGGESGRIGLNRDDRDTIWYPIHVGTDGGSGNGAYLTWGGTWTNGSSRSFKENFQPLDSEDLLAKISGLPVEAWQYKDSDERHIGPVSEDFVEAFDVGTLRNGTRDERYLSPGDVAGVALAGVKELIQENEELRQTIQELRQRISKLEGAGASKGGK